MSWSLCQADDVTKLTAICAVCDAPSTMAKLVSDDDSEIIEGNIVIEDETHHYVPMCTELPVFKLCSLLCTATFLVFSMRYSKDSHNRLHSASTTLNK